MSAKHGEMARKIQEGAVKSRSFTGSHARFMRERNVFMAVKRSLRNSICLPLLIYGADLRHEIGQFSQECIAW